jgi:hypothetical protein
MNDLERRALVAFPPVGEASWSGIGPVGMLRYRGAGVPAFAVAVRITSPLPRPGEPFLPGAAVPAWTAPRETPAFPPLAARELVPFKHDCDVGFLGTLASSGGAGPLLGRGATATMDVRIGDTRRGLSMVLHGERIDLAEVRATALGGAEVRLGPRVMEPFDDLQHFHLEDDAERFCSAGLPLRFPYPVIGSRIAVRSDFFSVDAELGFEAFLRVDYLDGTVSLPLTRCDAVTFDLDRGQVDWLFRAVAVDPAEGREIERIVVAAFAPGKDEERARVDAWLPHARFAWAAGPREVREQVHPEPLDEEDLAMARYSTWDTAHFASTLPIEEVAQIQVELVKGRDRAAVLEAHGLSAYQWSLEERAAMDRVAEAGVAAIDDAAPPDGEKRSAPDVGEDLTRYREAHARALAEIPFEGRAWTVPEYAELRAALEARNPVRVLEKAGLGPAELIGLSSAMDARFEASPADRQEYEECFEGAAARLEAADEEEDDFAPLDDDDDEDEDDGGER